MNQIIKNIPVSILVVYILIFILTILCLVLLQSNLKLEKKYRKLMRGINTKNLETLVIDYLDKIDGIDEKINNIKNDMKQVDDNLNKCIQKIAVIRYKAFENIGSDLSFQLLF